MHIQHSRTFKHQYGQDIPTVFFRRMRALHAVDAICHTLYQCCLLTCSRRSKSHSCFGGQGCWRQCTRWLRSHVKWMSCDVMWCYWRFIWCHVLPFFMIWQFPNPEDFCCSIDFRIRCTQPILRLQICVIGSWWSTIWFVCGCVSVLCAFVCFEWFLLSALRSHECFHLFG